MKNTLAETSSKRLSWSFLSSSKIRFKKLRYVFLMNIQACDQNTDMPKINERDAVGETSKITFHSVYCEQSRLMSMIK